MHDTAYVAMNWLLADQAWKVKIQLKKPWKILLWFVFIILYEFDE